ncbi:DUF1176 domain-containing protein [Sphingomonas abietis]|uniref:DUF1176 domain-containing protein n=1 Tax=Sphingomonas abietis TaxID=3012344 RepID=A0ABY7NPA7_9SPHN|nr:DUF1176 domain-containing protein [Sphingomonas abietis]WBO23208.1 DUF1176 domain-containing protein [Sphingomonas abietis]
MPAGEGFVWIAAVGGTALLFAVLTSPLPVYAAQQNTSVSPNIVQSYDSCKSWFVACDNGLHCIAKGISETYQGAEIDVDRNAGPTGRLSLSIRADRKFSLRNIRIDGKSVGLSAAAWKVDTSEDSTTVSSDDLVAIRQIVARLRNASKVTLGGDAEVSLDGFAAAMLRLDDRQGRVGGVTAIARYGPLPASSVPDTPALPRIPNRPISATLSQGEAERLIAAVRADQKAVFAKEDCEADTMSMEPEAYALDERQALILIPCIMGAYQGSSLGFIASRAGGQAMSWRGVSNRPRSPIVAMKITAEIMSRPRMTRSASTSGAIDHSGSIAVILPSSWSRRSCAVQTAST